jgi:hypothetical protein
MELLGCCHPSPDSFLGQSRIDLSSTYLIPHAAQSGISNFYMQNSSKYALTYLFRAQFSADTKMASADCHPHYLHCITHVFEY